jgi:hypothetical protein
MTQGGKRHDFSDGKYGETVAEMAESAFAGTQLYLLGDSSCRFILTGRHSRPILENDWGNRVPAKPIPPYLLDTTKTVTPTPRKFRVRYPSLHLRKIMASCRYFHIDGHIVRNLTLADKELPFVWSFRLL